MEQLILHGIGDYFIQNDWMALNKKKKGWLGFLACLVHCLTYSAPFFLIGSNVAVFFIFLTHFIIDRTHIVEWALAYRNGVKDIENFGFSHDRPVLISFWLSVITDNLLHIICNYLALKYL